MPRVFSTAAALALLATADAHTEVQVYRAKGSGVEPVDLTTRTGLTDHLAVLEVDLHPGEALEAFQKEIAGCDRAAEPVLITTEDVAADPHFRQALDESQIEPALLATVNRDGQFRLSERTLHGARRLREAQLDLAALFAEPKREAPPLMARERIEHLPAILSVQPFPLRLSHNVDWQRMCRTGDHGVLSLTHDRRLMLWTNDNYGAIQIMDDAPRGKLLWSSSLNHETVLAVVGHMVQGGLHLLSLNYRTLHCEVMPLRTTRLPDVFFSHNGILFALSKKDRRVDILDTSSGQLIETIAIPFLSDWCHGRFFHRGIDDAWYAASHDGRSLRFERIHHLDQLGNARLISMFECDGMEGPIGITERGCPVHHGNRRIAQSETRPCGRCSRPRNLFQRKTHRHWAQWGLLHTVQPYRRRHARRNFTLRQPPRPGRPCLSPGTPKKLPYPVHPRTYRQARCIDTHKPEGLALGD